VSGDWLRDERALAAAERLLDAAGASFAEQGVAATGMADVAARAGCSRATLYRYFANRDELRLAFVHREARRIGAGVAADVAGLDDPADRTVAAVQSALRQVRADPTLAAWFTSGDAGLAAALGQGSQVIHGLATAFFGPDADERGAWLVRVILSFLTVPGADDEEERRVLERFVAPPLVEGSASAPGGAGP
jgi:AcrR family transcriptional regulator